MVQGCCQGGPQQGKSESEKASKYVLYLNTEVMGRGDDGLGGILIKAFFETLAQNVQDVSHILLVNSAVKLACEDSSVLEYLKDFAEMGVSVLSCGTCIRHFGLEDKLKVGEISNMVAILDAMARSEKVISP